MNRGLITGHMTTTANESEIRNHVKEERSVEDCRMKVLKHYRDCTEFK